MESAVEVDATHRSVSSVCAAWFVLTAIFMFGEQLELLIHIFLLRLPSSRNLGLIGLH